MAKSVRVNVKSGLLEWARQSAGLDLPTAASKLGRTPDELAAWETGSAQPTIAQLRKAAVVYRRPLAVFLLDHVPQDPPLPKDFRRLDAAVPDEFSDRLRLLIRRTRHRQSWAREWRRESGWEALKFVASWSSLRDSRALASTIVRDLGLSNDAAEQAGSRNAYFNLLADLVEDLGVFVTRSGSVEPSEARGFALPDQYAPFVYVNSKDSVSARSFTLVHELAHIYMGSASVSNPFGSGEVRSGGKKIESFCNQVAADVLLPATKVRQLFTTAMQQGGESHSALAHVSSKLKVSEVAIAIRLSEMRLVSDTLVRAVRRQAEQDYKRLRDRQKETDGFVPWPRRYALDNGYAFLGSVIAGLNGGELSSRDASSLLGANLKYLRELREIYSDHRAKSREQRGAG